MFSRRFKQVDVFTTQPFSGNPVAVVLDADGLRSDEMQLIASWTNLSETTFVLPATVEGADYCLRIFTPKGELPFAGHPTIGSAHAILESGIVRPHSSCMVQECGSGLLPIRIENEQGEKHIFVKTPRAKVSSVEESFIDKVGSAVNAGMAKHSVPLLVDVGPVWLVVELENTEDVHKLKPEMTAIARLSTALNVTGITVFSLTGMKSVPVYTRSFAPAVNVPEDPVCGSGNASVAAFLTHFDLLRLTGRCYSANQGREVGRNGMVFVRIDGTGLSIEIGGSSVTCIDGMVRHRV